MKRHLTRWEKTLLAGLALGAFLTGALLYVIIQLASIGD